MSWTGLAAGIESGLRSYERVKRIQADDARYKAEADKLEREKRDRDVLDDINKTMTGAMGGDMDSAPTAEQPSAAAQQGTLRSMIGVQPEPQQSSAPQGGALRARFGGEPPAAPQGQGMSTPPAQRGPASLKEAGAPREVPRERRMVDAYRKGWARAFELGRPDLGMQYFQKETELRELLTKQALDKADRQFAVTQDPRVYIAPYNDLAPDGVRIEGMTPVLTADGSQAWKVVSRMPDMPEPVEQVIPGEELPMMIAGLHDQGAVRRSMLEVAQKQRESLIKRQEKEYEIGLRADAASKLEDRRTAGRLKVVGAQGAEARKTAEFRDKLPGGSGPGGTKAPPAAVATAQWLIDNGVAKDAAQAWNLVRTASSKSKEGAVLELTRSIMGGPAGYQYAQDPGKAAALARQIVDQIGGGESAPAGSGNDDPLGFEGDDPLGLFD
jgi:hypothetical protein